MQNSRAFGSVPNWSTGALCKTAETNHGNLKFLDEFRQTELAKYTDFFPNQFSKFSQPPVINPHLCFFKDLQLPLCKRNLNSSQFGQISNIHSTLMKGNNVCISVYTTTTTCFLLRKIGIISFIQGLTS